MLSFDGVICMHYQATPPRLTPQIQTGTERDHQYLSKVTHFLAMLQSIILIVWTLKNELFIKNNANQEITFKANFQKVCLSVPLVSQCYPNVHFVISATPCVAKKRQLAVRCQPSEKYAFKFVFERAYTIILT